MRQGHPPDTLGDVIEGCCGDSLLNVVMSPVGHKEQQGDDGVGGENQGDLGGRGPQAILTRSGAEQC
jgi:hypothetical protein